MPRPLTDLARRTITLDTGRRSVDLPVDVAGHVRRSARLDSSAIVRSADPAGSIGFKGHAAVFETRTWIGPKRWGFWEQVAPTAFTKTLAEADVRFLQNHDPNYVLARNTAGTLRLSCDAVGLATDADMAPTSYARDLAVLLERGDVSQMSFAFAPIDYTWTELADGTELLTHNEVQLYDVSVVTYPAYASTDASLRGDLLACARGAGLDDALVGVLAQRLADPDDELLVQLRDLVGRLSSGPAESTRTEPDPPATTTGPDISHHFRHLATRTALAAR